MESKELRAMRAKVKQAKTWEQEIQAHNDIIAAYSDNPKIREDEYAALGFFYLTVYRDINKAESHYRQALSINPANLDHHYMLGYTYSAGSRWDEAIVEFEYCTKMKPDNFEYFYVLGLVWWNKGNTEKAVGYLRNALMLTPVSSFTIHSLAANLLYMPVDAKVAEYAKYALEITPENISAKELYDEIHNLFKYIKEDAERENRRYQK